MSNLFKIFIPLLFLFSCNAIADEGENNGTEFDLDASEVGEIRNDFRDVKWGMSYDEVAATEIMVETW